jgi:hypothetical protein
MQQRYTKEYLEDDHHHHRFESVQKIGQFARVEA